MIHTRTSALINASRPSYLIPLIPVILLFLWYWCTYYSLIYQETGLDVKYDNLGNIKHLPIVNRFALLRQWLELCDSKHDCSRSALDVSPTRVIFVGSTSSDKLQLQLSTNQRHPVEYIALSHCWGKQSPEEKERFCTTPKNYNERLKGFSYHSLPKAFQDAITVTRELKKQYLWIDALCIIQGNLQDWEKEGKKMETVFASAYCTIAPSSASQWKEGFLERPQAPSQLEGNTSTRKQSDDFHELVDEGPLNSRAWVLQERVLSRRTIFFTTKQTYWECGMGVRCENFTTLKW